MKPSLNKIAGFGGGYRGKNQSGYSILVPLTLAAIEVAFFLGENLLG